MEGAPTYFADWLTEKRKLYLSAAGEVVPHPLVQYSLQDIDDYRKAGDLTFVGNFGLNYSKYSMVDMV